MTALPIEWVLVVFYGPSAHRATYGRLGGTHYTKDYIQLSRRADFTAALASLFATGGAGRVPLTYKWPQGSAPGQLIFRSADRPHLAWETQLGAPAAWRMSLAPNETTAETIPGDPSQEAFEKAEEQLALLGSRGAGQPYLLAIKLQGEPRTLHLRAYLSEAVDAYEWASVHLLPEVIRDLIGTTSQRSALASLSIPSGGAPPSAKVNAALAQLAAFGDLGTAMDTYDAETGLALAAYLENPGYGLFFDPSRNHDGWLQPLSLSEKVTESVDEFLQLLRTRFPLPQQGDAIAEALDTSDEEVQGFREQVEYQNYEVDDTYATLKTRGSAQRVFAEEVKRNYGFRCAITGIDTRDFLVAAHIVPWSHDQAIRLDPSNGICLSLIMDRALESGYLILADDLTISIVWDRVANDSALRKYLEAYDGKKVSSPTAGAPKVEYLQRRRKLTLPE